MDGTLPLLRKRVLTGIIVLVLDCTNTNAITLAKLRAVLTQDAPIGNEIAQAYEPFMRVANPSQISNQP